MNDSRDTDPDELREAHRRLRRKSDLALLAVALIIVVGSAIGWLATGKRDWMLGGLFFAVFPLVRLLYDHFVLLRSRSDPVETERRLVRLDEKHRRNARTVARWNGLLLVLASLFFFAVALDSGKATSSPRGGLLLALSAIFFIIVGALMMWWGWKKGGKSSS